MAVKVLLNQYTAINSVEYTNQLKSSALALDAEKLDATAFGDGWVENEMGLFSGTLTLNLLDDFADNSFDELIWALFVARTNVSFAVRPEDDTISASNPEYQGFITPLQYNMGGDVGQLAMKALTFPISGEVVRDVIA